MKYGILDLQKNEIILDAGTSINDAHELMAKLSTKEGRLFFGTNEENKEIWSISDFFEPIEKI